MTIDRVNVTENTVYVMNAGVNVTLRQFMVENSSNSVVLQGNFTADIKIPVSSEKTITLDANLQELPPDKYTLVLVSTMGGSFSQYFFTAP